MKKFPHQQFLEDNRVAIESLPDMLQKRIKGFDELEDDLAHTTDEDKEKLVDKLENLSHELAEDLEEHFEEQLENNDQEDDEQPEPVLEQVEEIVPEPEPEVLEEVVELEPTPEVEPEPEPEPTREATDEEILESLLADKKHTIQPGDLKSKGFKGQLGAKRLIVGKFCLHRGKYDTCYKILISAD